MQREKKKKECKSSVRAIFPISYKFPYNFPLLQPYYGYSNQEVINMVRSRQLLACPETCPSAVYSLMVECWHEQAVRRPSFPEIGHRLKVWQNQKRSKQQSADIVLFIKS